MTLFNDVDLSELVSVPITLLWLLLFLVIFVFFIHFVFRKAKPDKPPGVVQSSMESFVTGFDNLMDGVTGKRLRKTYSYWFSLLIFLIFTVVITFFGFESPALSLVFTFTLGSITFIGIYVVGISTRGLWGFIRHKYSNPLEIFQQFAPLLSISIRLFGATFGFTVILAIFPIIFSSTGFKTLAMYWPMISLPWSWLFNSVDIFLSFIQAYVFTVLTATYWSLELPEMERKERKAQKQAKKQQKKFENQTKNNVNPSISEVVDMKNISVEVSENAENKF